MSFDKEYSVKADSYPPQYDAAVVNTTPKSSSNDFHAIELADDQSTHLKRTMGAFDLTCIGLGCIIGAGIFVSTGRVMVTLTGPAVIISYIIAGACCTFSALCYAEFAALSPSAGSAYHYARLAGGEWLGWVIGWDLVLEYGVSAALIGQSVSAYLQNFITLCGGTFPKEISTTPWDYTNSNQIIGPNELYPGTTVYADVLATCVTLLIGGIVAFGIQESKWFNNSMVILKVIIVLFVISLGAYYFHAENVTPFAPYGYGGLQFFGNKAFGQDINGGAVGVLAGASTVFFAYIGFDAVAATSEEAKNPQRTLPIGIIGSLIIATSLYIAVCIVLAGMIPYSFYEGADTALLASNGIRSSTIFADVFTARGQHWAGFVVTIGAIAGLSSVALVDLLVTPRLMYAMARDGLLPAWPFKLNARTKTPLRYCLFQMVFFAAVSATISQDVLLDLVNIGTLLAFCIVCLSVPVLRYRQPDRVRPFRAPLSDFRFPLIPVVGAGLCIVLMLSLKDQNWYRLLGWFGAGQLIYFLFGRWNSKKLRAKQAALVPQEIHSPSSSAVYAGEGQQYNYDSAADSKYVNSSDKEGATYADAPPPHLEVSREDYISSVPANANNNWLGRGLA